MPAIAPFLPCFFADFTFLLFSFPCSRGTGADLPIQSNEAMASQWKQGLITLVYLQPVPGHLRVQLDWPETV